MNAPILLGIQLAIKEHRRWREENYGKELAKDPRPVPRSYSKSQAKRTWEKKGNSDKQISQEPGGV